MDVEERVLVYRLGNCMGCGKVDFGLVFMCIFDKSVVWKYFKCIFYFGY